MLDPDEASGVLIAPRLTSRCLPTLAAGQSLQPPSPWEGEKVGGVWVTHIWHCIHEAPHGGY